MNVPPGEAELAKAGGEALSESRFCASFRLASCAASGGGVLHSLQASFAGGSPDDTDAGALAGVNTEHPAAADALSMLSRAAALEARGLLAQAGLAYAELEKTWPRAAWIPMKRTALLAALARRAPAPAAAKRPKSVALVIGVEKYRDHNISSPWFGAGDARAIATYLGMLEGDVQIPAGPLLDEKATLSAIQERFGRLTSPPAADTLILFMASHGLQYGRHSYLIPHDGFAENGSATGISDKTLKEATECFRAAYIFLDACRFPESPRSVSNFGLAGGASGTAQPGRAYVLYSAGSGQKSGGEDGLCDARADSGPLSCALSKGHGYFTWAVLRALTGEMRTAEMFPTLQELFDYTVKGVLSRVKSNTQTPALDDSLGINRPDPVVPLRVVAPRPVTRRHERRPFLGPRGLIEVPVFRLAYWQQQGVEEARARFQQELEIAAAQGMTPERASRLYELLPAFRAGPQHAAAAAALRLQLNEASQSLLLRYLKGDEDPPAAADYQAAALYQELAIRVTRLLRPELPVRLPGFSARRDFFAGRALLFELLTASDAAQRERLYSEAFRLLDGALQSEPEAAHVLNAQGIALLEGARYGEAAQYFQDAIRREPYWGYPLHNLALTFMQMGRTAEAIRLYDDAIRVTSPYRRYGYLHYNRALLRQRRGEWEQARRDYQLAQAAYQSNGMWDAAREAILLNARGTLEAAAGRKSRARELYRAAIERTGAGSPLSAEPQFNLSLLERRGARVAALREALRLHPEHIPSRLELASQLESSDQPGTAEQAEAEYREILKQKPVHVAAMLSLAELLRKRGALDEALALAKGAIRILTAPKPAPAAAGAWKAWLEAARIHSAAGRMADAEKAREAALAAAGGSATARREILKMRGRT